MTVSPSVAIKGAIGLTAITAISTGSYLTYDHVSKDTVTSLSQKEGFTLLSSKDNDTEWLKRWKEYIEEGDNIWNLKDYKKKADEISDIPQSFKDACYNKATEKIRDNQSNTYQQVSKLCTKSFSIASLIQQEGGITLISAKLGENKWDEAWQRYLANGKNELGFESWARVKVMHPVVAPSNYSEKCSKKQTEEVKNKQDKAYLAVKNWCTE